MWKVCNYLQIQIKIEVTDKIRNKKKCASSTRLRRYSTKDKGKLIDSKTLKEK